MITTNRYNLMDLRHKRASAYFSEREQQFPGLLPAMDAFYEAPSLQSAQDLMRLYFAGHKKEDITSLQEVAGIFADKRLVHAIVESILDDEDKLTEIAGRSYPHPIGFDKLVLYSDEATGFKFRLHIYWRGNQRADMERMHLHRFEMGSGIVSGEITNHVWRVTEYDSKSDLLPEMQLNPSSDVPPERRRDAYAYSGYRRDAEGVLHKQFLGNCKIERVDSDTFVTGQSYAQILSDAHYVETNAETGKSNGDICSTIYIHSGGLKDDNGRGIPILFEDFRLASDDKIIETIPSMDPKNLRASLEKYRDFLAESLEFYEWIYDPRHGRNLSTGMIAGYLLSESFGNPHTISTWIDHEEQSKAILRDCNVTLEKLVRGEITLKDLSDDDRQKRYFVMLYNKAMAHPEGPEDWLDKYGDLVREMWRYCGAIKGEKPDVTVLKPMWMQVVGKRMPGGAHYGHVAAMIEAAYEADKIIMRGFKDRLETRFKQDGSPVSDADGESENVIRACLQEHFPEYRFYGEETGDSQAQPPQEGERRWLIDPIDGTRNFLKGRDDFCVSLACQLFENGKWVTTDGVIFVPMARRMFWAEKDKGAYIIGTDDIERQLHVNPDAQPALKSSTIDISLRGLGATGEGKFVQFLRAKEAVFRANGSTALMLAMVAGMGSDGVVATGFDYDVEAGKLIAAEAGAILSDIKFSRDGEDFIATICAQNQNLHDQLRAITTAAIPRAPKRARTLTP